MFRLTGLLDYFFFANSLLMYYMCCMSLWIIELQITNKHKHIDIWGDIRKAGVMVFLLLLHWPSMWHLPSFGTQEALLSFSSSLKTGIFADKRWFSNYPIFSNLFQLCGSPHYVNCYFLKILQLSTKPLDGAISPMPMAFTTST